jgi:hypothetical protein
VKWCREYVLCSVYTNGNSMSLSIVVFLTYHGFTLFYNFNLHFGNHTVTKLTHRNKIKKNISSPALEGTYSQ